MKTKDQIMLFLIINTLIQLKLDKEEFREIVTDEIYAKIEAMPEIEEEVLIKEFKKMLKTYIKKIV